MADPAGYLTQQFQRALALALGPDFATEDPVIRPSNQAGVDYQANAALALAKRLGRPPRDVAQSVLEHLDLDGAVEGRPDIGGPGFVNIRLATPWIADQVTA